MKLNKVAIKKLNRALNINRERAPLLCDLLGIRILYRGGKSERKICVLYFQNVPKEGSGATALFYDVNSDGTFDEKTLRYMSYRDLVIGIKFKAKAKVKKKKLTKKQRNKKKKEVK